MDTRLRELERRWLESGAAQDLEALAAGLARAEAVQELRSLLLATRDPVVREAYIGVLQKTGAISRLSDGERWELEVEDRDTDWVQVGGDMNPEHGAILARIAGRCVEVLRIEQMEDREGHAPWWVGSYAMYLEDLSLDARRAPDIAALLRECDMSEDEFSSWGWPGRAGFIVQSGLGDADSAGEYWGDEIEEDLLGNRPVAWWSPGKYDWLEEDWNWVVTALDDTLHYDLHWEEIPDDWREFAEWAGLNSPRELWSTDRGRLIELAQAYAEESIEDDDG